MDKKNTDQTKRRRPIKDILRNAVDPKTSSTDHSESEKKEEQKTEDQCLEKGKTEFCGKTDHL